MEMPICSKAVGVRKNLGKSVNLLDVQEDSFDYRKDILAQYTGRMCKGRTQWQSARFACEATGSNPVISMPAFLMRDITLVSELHLAHLARSAIRDDQQRRFYGKDFLSFLTFLHHGIEKEDLLLKPHKNAKENQSNMPRIATERNGEKCCWKWHSKNAEVLKVKVLKGKGNYLTSVAKQAKTAFLHGPTVWKSPIVGIEPATFRSESAAQTAPRDPTLVFLAEKPGPAEATFHWSGPWENFVVVP